MNIKWIAVNESVKCRKYSSIQEYQEEQLDLRTLSAARGDFAAFQLLLEGDTAFAVTLDDSAYFSPSGNMQLCRLEVRAEGLGSAEMYHIGFIADDDRLETADILLQERSVSLEANTVCPIWVEFNIPRETPAGCYAGKLRLFGHRMFEAEKIVFESDIALRVPRVLMPEKHRMYLDLWQHQSNVARKHEVKLWSDQHFAVMEAYIESLAALGQRAVTVIVSEIPWSGQRCCEIRPYTSDLFEYSMVRIWRDTKGYHYDFSVITRYVALCGRYGIDEEIEVFGLCNIWAFEEGGFKLEPAGFEDDIRLRYYDCETGTYDYIRDGEAICDYIRALEQYFIASGWIQKVRVAADEPADAALFQRRLARLRSIAPAFRYKTAVDKAAEIEAFHDSLDDFVPILPCAVEALEQRETCKGRMLWYVSCNPAYPNQFLVSHLLETRLVGWLTAWLKLDGFLRWNYTAWPERPRQRLSYNAPAWSAGDTCFVYPSNHGAPLLSLRYKMLRRAVLDFDLLFAVRDEAEKQALFQTLIKVRKPAELYALNKKSAADCFHLSYKAFETARQKLFRLIEEQE